MWTHDLPFDFLVSADVFANNRLSLTLVMGHSVSSVVMFSTDRHEYIHSLPEYLTDPEFGHSDDVNDAPFQYFIKRKDQSLRNMSYYDWIELAVSEYPLKNPIYLTYLHLRVIKNAE